MNKKQRDFFENVLREYNRPDTYGLTNLTRTSLAKILQEYSEIDAEPDPEPEYVVKLDGKTIYTSPFKEASFDLATDYLENLMRNSVAMKKANVLAYEKGKKLVIETLLQKYVYTVNKYTVEKL